jgi:hypothetical protein
MANVIAFFILSLLSTLHHRPQDLQCEASGLSMSIDHPAINVSKGFSDRS